MSSDSEVAADFIGEIVRTFAASMAIVASGGVAFSEVLSKNGLQQPFKTQWMSRSTMRPLRETDLGDLSDVGSPDTNKLFWERLAIQAVVAAGAEAVPFSDTKVPLTQFLRHLRNGCAHGNHFNITLKDDPIPIAKWREFEIIKASNGNKAVGWEDGLLSVTECGALLCDVADYLRALP